MRKGIFHPNKIPDGFQKIKVHIVFAVKYDERHKARIIANGNLTGVLADSVYAGVVSLQGLQMCIFFAKVNKLEAFATDIGNAYFEALTQEKVCIKAGPEFGEQHWGYRPVYNLLKPIFHHLGKTAFTMTALLIVGIQLIFS